MARRPLHLGPGGRGRRAGRGPGAGRPAGARAVPAAAAHDAERGRLEAGARRPGAPGALAHARHGPAGSGPQVRAAGVSKLTAPPLSRRRR
ncbi:hypothetical protein SGPA1_11985 [Streptomyces misionensis JCM 4497]